MNFEFACNDIKGHLNSAVYVHTLGKGMFASIKLYQCNDTHKLYVVKKLKFENIKKTYNEQVTSDADDTAQNVVEKMLQDEYRIGSILDHPNIIKTFGVDTVRYSLLIEHCPGVDLFEYLNKNKYFRNKKLLVKFAGLYMQVLSAVKYLHGLGIAHRDIKLENIMYDKQNHSIRLIDFGNAEYFKVGDVPIKSNKMKGTIEYLPPEVYSALEFSIDKIDVWSCGILLYNMVYNESPWKKSKKSDTRYNACRLFFQKRDLHPVVFPCPRLSGYNIYDAHIIKDIFVTIFHAEEPGQRPSIDVVCKMFGNLQVLSKEF